MQRLLLLEACVSALLILYHLPGRAHHGTHIAIAHTHTRKAVEAGQQNSRFANTQVMTHAKNSRIHAHTLHLHAHTHLNITSISARSALAVSIGSR